MSQIKRLKTPDNEVGKRRDNFNLAFDKADEELMRRVKAEAEQEKRPVSVQFKEPEKEIFSPRDYTDDLGVNMKNLFFDILEALERKENPIPYIMSSPQRQFTFAVMVISVGTITLFLSNLMI